MILRLNDTCQCVTLDEHALRERFDALLTSEGGAAAALTGRENLFSPYPVFVSAPQLDAMRSVIAAVHAVFALPAFVETVIGIGDWPDQHTHGVMASFDFHANGDEVSLIEINTNAGGAYLSALLAESQRQCCAGAPDAFAVPPAELAQRWLADFREEWRLARGDAPLGRVLIVDDAPDRQFLHPEFLLFRALFRRNGIDCDIVDATTLDFDGQRLVGGGGAPADLVYNRLTDFDLSEPEHRALRAAYRADAVVVTPAPRHHALMADKRHLVRLADAGWLKHIGVDAATRAVLAAHVPHACLVNADSADALWLARKRYFFKPFAGYGSRGAYRGANLTRRVWSEIVAGGDYIAQAYAPPPVRRGATNALKYDLRCVSYAGQMRLLSARLYQGQTTNLRTASGGLGSVIVPALDPRAVPDTCPRD